ncbi:hypothetical protein [Paraburkholderia xenovorans]
MSLVLRRRLETENRRLAQLLERETERRPVSLAEAFGRGPTVELGLAVELTGETHDIPACLTDALHVIMGGTATNFEVQRRGEAMRVVYEHNGIRHTLLTPSQWKEVQDWLDCIKTGPYDPGDRGTPAERTVTTTSEQASSTEVPAG